MYYQPIGIPQYEVDNTQTVADVQSRLNDLQSCWNSLEGQVDDKQARLEQTLQTQQVYQDAIMNISIWLDSIELKLSSPMQNHDLDKYLKDQQVCDIVSIFYLVTWWPQSLLWNLRRIKDRFV